MGHLVPGLTYEVSSTLATWLISRGVAEELTEESAELVVPLDNPRAFEQLTRGVSVTTPNAVADESTSKKKRKGR